ncbi:hypothetical protein BHM03_00018580 [Ensete ventricosum]|nr:hypothetical protein BHM03_00018580 [Ensete ventricosum]
MRFGGARSPFPFIWRKISVRVELRGVVGGCERLKSDPSILLLDGLEVGPRGCSVRGHFYSSRFPTIRVSTTMKWFALYIISGTMRDARRGSSCFGGESVDELGEGLLPSLGNAEQRGDCGLWSGVGQKVLLQFLRKLVEGNNGCRLETTIPHPSWSPQDGRENSTHERIGRVVQCYLSSEGRHSVGSELPSYDSKMGNLKLVGTGLSRISGAKGDLCLRFSPASSSDLVTSFCTSSSRSFMGCPTPAGCAPSRGAERSISPGRSKGSWIGPREDLVPLGHVRLALSVPETPPGW